MAPNWIPRAHLDEVGVKFGVKVTGTANWLIAKAAS
jgi:hypothetical protein